MWKAISLGTPAARLKLRRKLLDGNPFVWLASRDRLQAAAPWIISAALMVFIGLIFLRGALQREFLVVVGFAISLVVQLAISGAAGAQLYREYEQGTLEMVLSTPLSEHEVIRGQLTAAFRQYRGLFALAFLLLWSGIVLLFLRAGAMELIWGAALVASTGLVVLQFYAIGWLGMWAIVVAPDPRRATTNAFFLIAILPALIFGLIVVSTQFLVWLAGVTFALGPTLLLPLYFTLAFANSVYWLRRARRELPAQLRQFAFQRYMPRERLTFVGQIGRLLGSALRRARAPREQTLFYSP